MRSIPSFAHIEKEEKSKNLILLEHGAMIFFLFNISLLSDQLVLFQPPVFLYSWRDGQLFPHFPMSTPLRLGTVGENTWRKNKTEEMPTNPLLLLFRTSLSIQLLSLMKRARGKCACTCVGICDVRQTRKKRKMRCGFFLYKLINCCSAQE